MLGCSLLAVVALFFCFLYGSLGYLCMMGGVLAKLFGFVVLVDSVSGVSSMFLYDGMSLFLSILSVWVSSLTVLAMSNTDSKNSPLFFFFSGMMLCMLLFSFMLFDLLGFYLFFEAVLIPMVMMIYLWGKQLERQTAGLYMLMYTLFGSLPLLVVLLGVSFKMEVSYMFLGYFVGLDIKNLFMFMLFFAFLVKMPMYSVHLWLPKAHVEAPVAGSMMLAGILLKLGAYGFYRVYFMICYWHLYFCDFLVMSVSLVGSVIVSFICLRQTDVKCLIAYSSVCHMGLVIGGCYSGTIYSSSGVLILMLGHGLCSSALFCLSSFMYERFFTRSLLLMSGMMGIFPILSLWWFIFCVINMGAPPFMNLCGEILLLATILMWDFYSIFLVCLISFFSAGYSLYLFSFLQHGSSWFVYGGLIVNMCEFVLLYGHFFPLFLYLMKMDIFINWV